MISKLGFYSISVIMKKKKKGGGLAESEDVHILCFHNQDVVEVEMLFLILKQ